MPLLLLLVAIGAVWAFAPGLGWPLDFGRPSGTELTATPPPTAALAVVPEQAAAVAAAPYCAAGESPRFALGFARLRERVGSAMGEPLDCEHAGLSGGDSVQTTTTGLAVFTRAGGTVQFTDGWRHWRLRGDQLETWEGTEAEPPAASPSPAPAFTAGTIANTDGLGVLLRTAPNDQARSQRALRDGTAVRVLERSGDYLRVQAADGTEGWVPAQYVSPASG